MMDLKLKLHGFFLDVIKPQIKILDFYTYFLKPNWLNVIVLRASPSGSITYFSYQISYSYIFGKQSHQIFLSADEKISSHAAEKEGLSNYQSPI